MGYLAGIDLGTSSVKVLLMDPDGRTLAVSSRGYDVMTPKLSYAEQEPQVWWDCTVMAIREAMEKSGIRPEELDCIGLSGQMHGLVAFDRNNEPVMPAIIWMDQRSAEETARIKELAGDLLDTELLNQPGAGMMICSLLWLKRHRPDVYDFAIHSSENLPMAANCSPWKSPRVMAPMETASAPIRTASSTDPNIVSLVGDTGE